MENKLIKVEDLEIGDEIIISCQSYFKYLKVLTTPKLSKTKVHWHTAQPLYGNVKCSTRQEIKTSTFTGWNGTPYTKTYKKWKVTAEDHNIRIYQDLNDRQIWLVKKNNLKL